MPPKRKSVEATSVEPRRSSRTSSAAANVQPKSGPKAKVSSKKQKTEPSTRSPKKLPEDGEARHMTVLDTDDTKAEEKAPKDNADEKVSKNDKKLRIGDRLPDISLEDQSAESVSLLAEANEHGLVLFSYPAASTPGCTSQGCSYRDHYDEIVKKGYKVFGISTDTVNAQAKFKNKQSFQYPLLSDPKKQILSVLGGSSSAKKTALRCHWVFKKGGTLEAIEINVKPKDCVAKALASIDEIEKK